MGGAKELNEAVLELGSECPPCSVVSLYSSSSDEHSSSVKSNSSSLPGLIDVQLI